MVTVHPHLHGQDPHAAVHGLRLCRGCLPGRRRSTHPHGERYHPLFLTLSRCSHPRMLHGSISRHLFGCHPERKQQAREDFLRHLHAGRCLQHDGFGHTYGHLRTWCRHHGLCSPLQAHCGHRDQLHPGRHLPGCPHLHGHWPGQQHDTPNAKCLQQGRCLDGRTRDEPTGHGTLCE